MKRRKLNKAERSTRARKASVNRRVAVPLAKFLKQANPAMKTSGAKVEKLKGGVIKITPIKANAGQFQQANDLMRRALIEKKTHGQTAKLEQLTDMAVAKLEADGHSATARQFIRRIES